MVLARQQPDLPIPALARALASSCLVNVATQDRWAQLRLIFTHPDRMGGLRFVGQYPNAYATFVFAISCVVAAAVAKELMGDHLLSWVAG